MKPLFFIFLSFFICVSRMGSQSLPGETPEPRIIAWWRFEVGKNGLSSPTSSRVSDSTTRHPGTILGSPTYQRARTPTGGVTGLRFTDASDGVAVSDAPEFHLSSMTIEAYVIADPNPAHYGLIVFRGDDRVGYDPFSIQYNQYGDGTVAFDIQPDRSTRSRIYSPTGLVPGRLYHIAATFDAESGEQSLYIDHEKVASTLTSIRPIAALDPAANPGLGIGNDQRTLFGEHFEGTIAEVRNVDGCLCASNFLPAP